MKGEGITYAEDQELRWEERDTFVIPNWTRHRHANTSAGDAILFSVTDEPLLRAIGLYREDPEDIA
jgi:gentisate 1,2-dioxygenase